MTESLTNAALVPEARWLLDRYDFLAELGRGGMGIVYLARERATGRSVAIKLLGTSHVGNAESALRFAREARTVATLEHPNIVRTFAIEELGGGALAIVSEYIPGRTLRDRLRDSGPLPFDQAARVLRDVASALAHAHAFRIVHRDVKPDNIFVANDGGRALLADFGIARTLDTDTQLTSAGSSLGTPSYMAPEQVKGLPVDERADVYSLGLVGWEMLSGARPWEGETLYGVLHKQQHEPLPSLADLRPDIPTYLLVAIEGALAKLPKDRWADAGELLVRLTPTPATLPKRRTHGGVPLVDDATVPIPRQVAAPTSVAPGVAAPAVVAPAVAGAASAPPTVAPVAQAPVAAPVAAALADVTPIVGPPDVRPADVPVEPTVSASREPLRERIGEPVGDPAREPIVEPLHEPPRRVEAGVPVPPRATAPPSMKPPAGRRKMGFRGPLLALLASTLIGLLFFLKASGTRSTFPSLDSESTVRADVPVRDSVARNSAARDTVVRETPRTRPPEQSAEGTLQSAPAPAPRATPVPPRGPPAVPPETRPAATTPRPRDTTARAPATRPRDTASAPPVAAKPSTVTGADARCSTPTSAAQRACLMAGIDRNDVDLNRTYQALIAQLRRAAGGVREPPAVVALRVQQRAWVNQRDRACMRNPGAAAGSLWGAERIPCFARMSEEREAELRGRLRPEN